MAAFAGRDPQAMFETELGEDGVDVHRGAQSPGGIVLVAEERQAECEHQHTPLVVDDELTDGSFELVSDFLRPDHERLESGARAFSRSPAIRI